MGDFNADPSNEHMLEFMSSLDLRNLITDPTCFKNIENPSCIDLIITNRPKSFQHSRVIETGISDFHKLTITVIKMKFNRYPPSVISYREYKSYSPYLFRAELNCILSFDLNFINNDTFTQIVMELLNKHCPIKFKYIRGNDSPFMTKELRKAIMQRSKLRNRLNKLNTIEASDNCRNYCTSLLRKTKKSFFKNLNPSDISDNKKSYFKNLNPSDISDNKKSYFSDNKKSYFKNLNPSDISDNKKSYFKNLNPSDISDNKKFWKIVKPLFSEKTSSHFQ